MAVVWGQRWYSCKRPVCLCPRIINRRDTKSSNEKLNNEQNKTASKLTLPISIYFLFLLLLCSSFTFTSLTKFHSYQFPCKCTQHWAGRAHWTIDISCWHNSSLSSLCPTSGNLFQTESGCTMFLNLYPLWVTWVQFSPPRPRGWIQNRWRVKKDNNTQASLYFHWNGKGLQINFTTPWS